MDHWELQQSSCLNIKLLVHSCTKAPVYSSCRRQISARNSSVMVEQKQSGRLTNNTLYKLKNVRRLLQRESRWTLPLLNPVTAQIRAGWGAVACEVKCLAWLESLRRWEFWGASVEDVTFHNMEHHHTSSCWAVAKRWEHQFQSTSLHHSS